MKHRIIQNLKKKSLCKINWPTLDFVLRIWIWNCISHDYRAIFEQLIVKRLVICLVLNGFVWNHNYIVYNGPIFLDAHAWQPNRLNRINELQFNKQLTYFNYVETIIIYHYYYYLLFIQWNAVINDCILLFRALFI